jgi:hypothetical protein
VPCERGSWRNVRDQSRRSNRPGPSKVTEDGGQVLAEFESPRLYDEADQATLSDGTEVTVVGI